MSRIRRSIVVAIGVLLVAPIVSAGPQLWLYPEETGPREGGHIVPPGNFKLVIENRGKASDENKVWGVELVVAVNNPSSITTLSLVKLDDGSSLELGGFVEGTPELLCGGKLMPRHGVYPASYAKVLLGDLTGGQLLVIDVTVEGGSDLYAHFDAMGVAWKTNGNGEKCSDVSNPAGHDVTVGQRPGGRDDCARVSITKTADFSSVEFGDEVRFEIEVLNDGTCDLTELVLRDFIPAVKDEGEWVPAFSVVAVGPSTPVVWNDELIKWDLTSSLPVGEQDGVFLEVVFDQPAADGRRVVNRACISADELRKPRCAAAVVTVGNPYGDDGPAGPGFWCHAARFILEDRRNAPVAAEDFDEWLLEIGERSFVFHDVPDEPYDASTPELASDLLCTPQSAEGAADRLARHLLTLWLNVTSGRLEEGQNLDDLCYGDELMPDGVDPTTVMELIIAAEDALLAPVIDDEMLTFLSEVVDAVNNSLAPDDPACIAPRATAGRHGAGPGLSGGKNRDRWRR